MCGQMETQLPSIVRLYLFSLSLFFYFRDVCTYGYKNRNQFNAILRWQYTLKDGDIASTKDSFLYIRVKTTTRQSLSLWSYMADKPRIIWNDSK